MLTQILTRFGERGERELFGFGESVLVQQTLAQSDCNLHIDEMILDGRLFQTLQTFAQIIFGFVKGYFPTSTMPKTDFGIAATNLLSGTTSRYIANCWRAFGSAALKFLKTQSDGLVLRLNAR